MAYKTYIVNTIFVNGKVAFVSLDAEEAHNFSVAEKAKGNKTEFKAYATNKEFMKMNSDYIDDE
jgi:hypothetical protein